MNSKLLTPEIVPSIRPWFEDLNTEKYLGGYRWIDTAVERFSKAIGKEFRGARVIDRIGYVFYQEDTAIGYAEAEVYDQLTTVDKNGEEIVIKIREPLITAAIVYVVAPEFRGKGIAKSILEDFISLDRFKDVKAFVAGTEEENVASMKLLESVGFSKRNAEPDFEDMINWELRIK